MKTANLFVLVAIALLTFVCLPLEAQSHNILVDSCLGTNLPGPNFCNLGSDLVQVFDGATAINDTFGSLNVGAQLTGTASGAAKIGVLRASSKASFNLTQAGHAFSSAIATFNDTLLISFPPLNRTPGKLLVRYTLSGSASSANEAVGLGVVSGFVGSFSKGRFSQQYSRPVSGKFVAGTFDFIYGQFLPMTFQLSADSGTIVGAGAICVSCLGSGSASANFANTFVLSGLEFFDANGNPLPSSPSIMSSSGIQYSVNGILTSFDAFSASVELSDSQFDVKGAFNLGIHSSGIDPLSEDVALQVGDFSAVIPGGSFRSVGRGRQFKFEGAINGLPLEVDIKQSEGGGFTFSAEGKTSVPIGLTTPTTISLSVGEDGGTTLSSPHE